MLPPLPLHRQLLHRVGRSAGAAARRRCRGSGEEGGAPPLLPLPLTALLRWAHAPQHPPFHLPPVGIRSVTAPARALASARRKGKPATGEVVVEEARARVHPLRSLFASFTAWPRREAGMESREEEE